MANNSTTFNSFLNLLLARRSRTDSNKKLTKTEIYDNCKFDLWFCAKGRSFSGTEFQSLDLQLDTLFPSNKAEDEGIIPPKDNSLYPPNIMYLRNLGNLDIQTVFSEDGLPSEETYQHLLDIPASAYIFSKNQYPIESKVNQDYNYKAIDFYVADTSELPNAQYDVQTVLNNDVDIMPFPYRRWPNVKKTLSPYNKYSLASAFDMGYIKNEKEKKYWERNNKYFLTDYGFSSGYEQAEYYKYNVPEETVIDDQTNFYSDTLSFDLPSVNTIGGALLVTWYDGERRNIYYNNGDFTTAATKDSGKPNQLVYENMPVSTGESIPCFYMELPKNYNLKAVNLNIEWSENGIVSLN